MFVTKFGKKLQKIDLKWACQLVNFQSAWSELANQDRNVC